MTAHSPTPWRFAISNYRCLKDHGFGPNRGHGTGSVGGCDYQFQGWEEDGYTLSCEATKLAVAVFDDSFEPASADAEFILRAVNCHDELVEVAKSMHGAEQREYGEILPCGQGKPCPTCAVLAKAEGK